MKETEESVHPATIAKEHSKDEMERRLGSGRVVTVDDALGILAAERRNTNAKVNILTKKGSLQACSMKRISREAN